ncbi:MAG: hypothetical protein KC609_17230, partial [Myxococcales bacterium]|nr:hypothetical protein [Myxococcales bacterium]
MSRVLLATMLATILMLAAACDRPVKPGLNGTSDATGDVGPDTSTGPDGVDEVPDADTTTSADADDDATGDSASVDSADGDGLAPDTKGLPEGDDDNDGVKNAKEKELGTDPDNPDSDGDGFWDGWEVNVGTDPKDKNSHPEYALPPGKPLLLQLKRIVLPTTLGAIIPAGQLDRVPPIFLFVDGLTDGQNDNVNLDGGIGTIVSNGPDDVAGTEDDLFGLRSTSFNQQTGNLLISLTGTVQNFELGTAPNEISVDLSSVSTLTKGIVLTVSNATITGTFNSDFSVLSNGILKGELTLDTIKDILSKITISIPLTPAQILALLDPDKNGIVEAEFEIVGRTADVVGVVVVEDEKLPEKREPGVCCPDGLSIGDPIDSALVVQDQGIQDDEEELAPQFVDALLTDPEVDLVATMRVKDGQKHYYVYAMRNKDGVPTRMEIEYIRERKDGKQSFTILNTVGDNPLALFGDPQSIPVVVRMGTIDEELSLGSNPFNTTYPDEGYLTPDDPRLSFVESEQMSYPFAYERLAAVFDDPRAPDMIVVPRAYVQSFSTHGSLDSPQSRSPLIVVGKGIKSATSYLPQTGDGFEIKNLPDGTPSLFLNTTVRQVDVAPTIGAALKLQKIVGVNEHGFLSDQNYLAWQDGHPLLELFLQNPELANDPPKYAVIIINDGLTNNELVHQVLNKEYDVPG